MSGAGAGTLALHLPPGGAAADRFAWMAEPGVYAGRLSLDEGSGDGEGEPARPSPAVSHSTSQVI